MHVKGATFVAALAVASSVSARAIAYRPEERQAAPTGALEKRADLKKSSVVSASASGSVSGSVSSVSSVVTTLPISTSLATKSGVWSTASPAPFSYGTPDNEYWGVKARGKNGPTNPEEPSLGTPINQSSVSRLASVNSIDDWCTFAAAPLNNTDTLGDIEQTTVAYCTKQRNNARVIPDGTLTAVQFVKTPLYIQLYALGDFTKINMAAGDSGGELDPHGATNMGNPIGGNVTSNIVDGKTDVFYEEWMNYISASEMCFRVCIAGSNNATPAIECQHQLDEMGCSWVMAQLPINNGTFESCEGDAAYPPGLYPQPDGSTSTFQQYYSGVYTVGATAYSYQNAFSDQETPSAPYSYPTPSACQSTATISNGLKGIDYKPAVEDTHDHKSESTSPSSAAPTATTSAAGSESSVATDSASVSVTGASGAAIGVKASLAAGSAAPAGNSSPATSSTGKASGAESRQSFIGGAVALVAALGAGAALI